MEQPKFNAPLFQSDLEPHWQGRESDVVIYSAVRTEGLGFVSDLQRLNVALTRARHSLFIVGNAQSLSSSEDWDALIRDSHERSCWQDVSVDDRLTMTFTLHDGSKLGEVAPRDRNLVVYNRASPVK
ncbi:MAG: hypothetical protein SGPRY_006296 [Prymnesium sp.]